MRKWKCSVCGYVHEGEEPPDECPVCGADKSKFVEIAEVSPMEMTQELSTRKGDGTFDKLVDFMLKNHFHPISVHTPNGIVPAAVLFLFLAVAFKMASFEIPAFYNIVFVLFAMPVVLFSGFIEWQKHYKGVKTSIFYIKICCGLVVFVSLLILVIWRIAVPNVAGPESSSRWLYLLLHFIALGAVGVAGNLGGKLVFGGKR